MEVLEMKLVTTITIVEEAEPHEVNKLREAFLYDNIKDNTRVRVIEKATSVYDVNAEDITVEFEIQEDDE
jgi:hypothetical protein